jgi:hypothetical protein
MTQMTEPSPVVQSTPLTALPPLGTSSSSSSTTTMSSIGAASIPRIFRRPEKMVRDHSQMERWKHSQLYAHLGTFIMKINTVIKGTDRATPRTLSPVIDISILMINRYSCLSCHVM